MELCFLCDGENTGGCGGMGEVLLSFSGIFRSFQLQRNNLMEMRVQKSQTFVFSSSSWRFVSLVYHDISQKNYLKNPSRFEQTKVQDKIPHNIKEQENEIPPRKFFKSNPLRRLLFITLNLKHKIDVIIFAISVKSH
jgi:hypothetical protein